jgi:sugar (pentulose or hexulose) kinase
MQKTILSIDCGTQSLRALLFDPLGELLDIERVEYEPYYSTKPGWAEQDPEILWDSLCIACKNLKDRNIDAFENIAGVGVTTCRASMVNVDKNGKPVRDIITWLDQRKAGIHYRPKGLMKYIYKAVGMYEPLMKIQSDGKCNWIRKFQPEVWEKTYKYLQVSGFFNMRLTGKFQDSIASQIGYMPFDYKKMKWDPGKGLTSLLFPVEKEKLAELVPPGTIIGHITKEASEQTSIPSGVRVIATGSDKGCETIGMGVLDQKSVSLSFGTTATVQTTTKKYFEPVRFLKPYPACVPGHYNPEVEIFRGFWMITWFKNEFAQKEKLKAEEKGIPTEVELDNLLRKSPKGAMGLITQPLWGPGLKNPEAKGAMIGFGEVHKREHIYRSVIEGLCFALLEGKQKIERNGKVKVERVAVSGGASQSDEICKIAADIFDLPIIKGKTSETSGLGAAIITAVGASVYPDYDTAIKKMVHYSNTFIPDKENVKIYRKLYKKVYLKMYASLQPLYEEIRKITGYPEE